MATFRSKLTMCVAPVNPVLHTENLFDVSYKEPADSPISEFLKRLHLINRLAPKPTDFDHLQGQLVLLGVIAAVESYFRTLFRRLIAIDPVCQENTHECNVSFGAAIHLSKEMLPEAILEGITFISRRAIVEDALRDLVAIKGNLPPDLELAIKDYVRICQLRHCAVHRFGKLGVRNAIWLGLSNHKKILEKPLKITYSALQDAIAISTGLVKTVNNFLFNEVLSRIPQASWTGVYAQDKKLFMAYYGLFADKVSTVKSAAPSTIYRELQKQQTSFARGIPFAAVSVFRTVG